MHKLPKYEGEKFEEGSLYPVKDYLTIEEALQININDDPFTVIMRSPGYEEDMVRGLLHNEDIYSGDNKLKLDDKIGLYLDLDSTNKSQLIIREILAHQAGFRAKMFRFKNFWVQKISCLKKTESKNVLHFFFWSKIFYSKIFIKI